MRRVDVTGHLVGNFGADEVDLFTPMLVDLGMGLGDVEKTTLSQQVALQEKISRLSMQGRLPVPTNARVHPFVGFDPRRELRSRKLGDIVTPLEVLQRAVLRYGFVGVKMYPPMGFTPTSNTPTSEIETEADAAAIDGILEELYTWCAAEHVPITVHCNASNDAADEYRLFSRPSLWAKVLKQHPDLHLNLGHFGGTSEKGKAREWAVQIARLANDFPHLYADVGCHRIDKREVAAAYQAKLTAILGAEETRGMRQRLMYGSDWFMLALAPKNDQFLKAYRKLYAAAVDNDRSSLRRFLGGAALDFLGFSAKARREGNKNGARLLARYAEHAPDRVPGWLTSG
jgi:predicted TIM-barrel fold metal-dependent hydrolase